MRTKRSFATSVTYWLKVVSPGLVLGLGLQFAQAWTAPSVAPPGGNVSGPVTLGAGTQYKTGKLGVNSNIAPINAFEIGGGGDALIGGKAYSASTLATDLGTTLATKDYVDGKAKNSTHPSFVTLPSFVGNYPQAIYCFSMNGAIPSNNEYYFTGSNPVSKFVPLGRVQYTLGGMAHYMYNGDGSYFGKGRDTPATDCDGKSLNQLISSGKTR